MSRIVLISDLHLSPTHGFFWPNFVLARNAANALAPEAVIIAGDLAINGPDSDAELAFAARALGGLSAKWLPLPGNHDVGDEPPGQDVRQIIDAPRLARWASAFGPDHFRLDLAHWVVLGLNSQLPGSGLAEEAAQNAWLDAELARTNGRRVAIVMHKPLFVEHPGEDVASPACTVPAARPGLMARFAAAGVELVVSGHLHTFRDRVIDGVRYLWAPATSFVSGHGHPGTATCGFLTFDFEASGVRVDLVRPAGLVDHSLVKIKQHGRYPFLRDMPPCPPEIEAAAAPA